MKTINRYIIKEFFYPFTLGLSIFTFVLLLSQIRKLTDLLVLGDVSAFVILKMLLCIIPFFLVIALPITILLASVIIFGRFSVDKEIIAMMASGITFRQLSKPILLISAMGYIATFFLTVIGVPRANKALREIVMENVQKTIISSIQEGIFNDKIGDVILYVDNINHETNVMYGIFIADYRNGKKTPIITFARKGKISIDPVDFTLQLLLLDGSLEQSEGINESRFKEVRFKKYRIRMDVKKLLSKKKKQFKKRREWELERLYYELKQAKRRGEEYIPMEIDLIKKFSLPVTCFIFGVLSLPLGINTDRGHKAKKIPVCIALTVLYYLLWNACENIAKAGILNPYFALWMPNIIMGTIAIILFVRGSRISKSSEWTITEILGKMISKLRWV